MTLWELFDNAAQPYSNLSNLDVLNQVVRERGTKLPKPQLEQPYSDRWLVTSGFVLLCSEDKEILCPRVLVLYSPFLNKCYKKQSLVCYSWPVLELTSIFKVTVILEKCIEVAGMYVLHTIKKKNVKPELIRKVNSEGICACGIISKWGRLWKWHLVCERRA